MYITVKADIQEATDTLDGYEKNRKSIKKSLLKMSGRKTKSKIDKWYYITLKGFCIEKETINKTKGCLVNGRRYLQMIHLRSG